MTDDRHIQNTPLSTDASSYLQARLGTPLSPAEASAYLQARWGLRRSTRTLQGYRREGGGPPFFRVGNDVRYTQRIIDEWAARSMGEPVTSTSEQSARRLMAVAASKEG
jgi:hypothetical protein